MTAAVNSQTHFPLLRPAGLDGMLISFADSLGEAANRAALSLRAALEQADWPEIEETSTSLVSVLVRFDAMRTDHDAVGARIAELLASTDWYATDLPHGRRLWHIPCVFGTSLAPQLEEAAALAGMSPADAIESIAQTRLRVQTIGFAPGQPYLGTLPEQWDIPRQTALTAQIPVGSVAVAIRQLVMFTIPSPTGWRHVGQTAFRSFRPESETPFVLRAGDEIRYVPTTPETLGDLSKHPDGGATVEPIP